MMKDTISFFHKIIMFVFVYTTMFFVAKKVFRELRKEVPLLAEEHRKMWEHIYFGIFLLGILFLLLYKQGIL